MATKKTNSSSKTKTAKKITAKKNITKKANSKAKASKTTVKTSKPKTVHATEPYHPIFGIILLVICAIITAVLLVAATKEIVKATFSDAEKFASAYTEVEADNIYKIRTAEETIKILEKGTGVVFIGFPSCPWCQAYAPMLNDLAKEHGLTEISYFDIKGDRKENTDNYKKIVSLLSDYLQIDEEGNDRVYVPEVAFVINGTLIGNDWETSKDTLGIDKPEDYWTTERVMAWKKRIGDLIDSVKASEGCTTSCNE